MWEFFKIMLWACLFFAILGVVAAALWGWMGDRVMQLIDALKPKNKAQFALYNIALIVAFFWLVLKFPALLGILGYHP